MSNAQAPGRPRGGFWLCAAVALFALSPQTGWAQRQPAVKAKGAPAKPAAKGEAAKPAAPKAEEPEAALLRPEGGELWQDPNRRELVSNTYKEVASPGVLTDSEKRAVRTQADGTGQLDRNLVKKYVQFYAAELTQRANIKALMDADADPRRSNALEEAMSNLLDPLLRANAANAGGFRTAYLDALQEFLPTLLAGHLHTRTLAMVVLSRAGDARLLPTFLKILADQSQPLTVKLLAAVGITNLVDSGRRPLPPAQAAQAAQGVADFLRENRDTFWPAQWRALEALGALRQATSNQLGGKAELAAVAFEYLIQEDARPEVRTTAAWALGMIQVPSGIRGYNFALIGEAIGRLAVKLGDQAASIPLPVAPAGAEAADREKVDALRNRNAQQILRSVDLLLRLLLALERDPQGQIRDSGFLNDSMNHPDLADARSSLREVDRRVRTITQASVELGQAVAAQIESKRAALTAAVNDLRTYLAQNPVKNRELYPGGPSYPLPARGAAGAAAAK